MLYGKNYQIKNDYDILSESQSQERNYLKNLILFTEIYYNNLNNSDLEKKFQSVILYIAYKIIGDNVVNIIIEVNNKVNIKDDIKEDKRDATREIDGKISKKLRDLFKELISRLNESNN